MKKATVTTDKTDKSVVKNKNGGARPGSGRPAFCPTDEERDQVGAWASIGMPIDQMASLIRDGIDDDTLSKHFKRELVRGRAQANASVGGALYMRAMQGDVTAQIWWTKARMGWTDKTRHELTGADGGPIAAEILHTMEPGEAYRAMISGKK